MGALELSIRIQIGRHHAQQRIALPCNDVGFNHLGKFPDRRRELVDSLRVLRNQRYPGKHRQADSDLRRAQKSRVRLNDALTLQPAHTA